jgi:hypothetical protein
VAIQQELHRLLLETNQMLSSDLGIIDKNRFQQHLKRAAEGQEQRVVPLQRTLLLEAWLRHVSHWAPRGESPADFLGNLRAEAYTPDVPHSLS